MVGFHIPGSGGRLGYYFLRWWHIVSEKASQFTSNSMLAIRMIDELRASKAAVKALNQNGLRAPASIVL